MEKKCDVKENIVIAIDGPAGAGKSSIAKIIAEKLSVEYVDSGAIYRAITKKILDSKLKIDDYRGVAELLKTLQIELKSGRVFVNGEDFSPFIRTKEVTESVSPVSRNKDIRDEVNCFLNEYSKDKSIIMDGRDITTVVFPNADYKFYLDASVKERALRRYNEFSYSASLEEIEDSIKKRDESDKNKEYGALKMADDAVYIDSTSLTIEEVVNKIIQSINK